MCGAVTPKWPSAKQCPHHIFKSNCLPYYLQVFQLAIRPSVATMKLSHGRWDSQQGINQLNNYQRISKQKQIKQVSIIMNVSASMVFFATVAISQRTRIQCQTIKSTNSSLRHDLRKSCCKQSFMPPLSELLPILGIRHKYPNWTYTSQKYADHDYSSFYFQDRNLQWDAGQKRCDIICSSTLDS